MKTGPSRQQPSGDPVAGIRLQSSDDQSSPKTQKEVVLDHIFISVNNLAPSISFYEQALAPLGFRHGVDYDRADGPAGHPDLTGFGCEVGCLSGCDRAVLTRVPRTSVLSLKAWPAMATGATDNGALGPRLHYDPRYYAATIFDPDGYSIKVVYKSWHI